MALNNYLPTVLPEPSAAVEFQELSVYIPEGKDVELVCLLFTTNSSLVEDVKVNIRSVDDTAVSFSIDEGMFCT